MTARVGWTAVAIVARTLLSALACAFAVGCSPPGFRHAQTATATPTLSYEQATSGDPAVNGEITRPPPSPATPVAPAESTLPAFDAASTWRADLAALERGEVDPSFDCESSHHPLCDRLAAAIDDERPALVEALRSRAPRVTARVFALYSRVPYSGDLTVFTRGLPALFLALIDDPERSREAALTVAEEVECGAALLVVRASGKLWPARPDRRGELLYLIAATAFRCPERETTEDRQKLLTALGAPFTASDLDAMLDASPRALALAPQMWRFVKDSRERTRVDAVVSHLGPFLDPVRGPDACHVRSRGTCGPAFVHQALDQVRVELATAKDARGTAALHAALAAHARRPEVDVVIGDLVDATRADVPMSTTYLR